MKKLINIIVILGSIVLFFLIRAFEDKLFYDPLIVYFQNDYLYTSMPKIELTQFSIDLFARYFLNSILSIMILWFLFKKKRYIIFASKFYIVAFVILFFVLVFLIKSDFNTGYLLPFYVRRFLIHPLFLFILLPAFYHKNRFR